MDLNFGKGNKACK